MAKDIKDDENLNITENTVIDEKPKKKKRNKVWNILFYTVFNPIVAILIVLCVIGIPFMNTYKVTFGAPSVYDNVFVAELGEKYDKLKNTDERKIAVIGGSSVAFGLDSELLSMYTGYDVVNFGLYATLGSKVMLDLSENEMNKGDIVVFAPELDAQTLSMYFGAKSVWQAADVNRDILKALKKSDRRAMLDAFSEYKNDKKTYLDEDRKPDPSGVYNSKNFNEYGDINYPRPYNTMAMGYDPNTLFTFEKEILSSDFVSYFNEYVRKMADKGVRVYFSFCPINELAVTRETSSDDILEFEKHIRDSVVCPVISSLQNYIMNWGYFYDTNLHLNDAGVRARTIKLIEDVKAAVGDDGKITVSVPTPPGKESGNELFEGDNTYMDYFTYEEEKLPTGEVIGLTITGVTDAALANTAKEITIPTSNGERMVIRVMGNVLSKIPGLEKVHFGKNIRALDDELFKDCKTLTDAYIDFGPDDCNVTVPDETNTEGLMRGASKDLKIHAKAQYKDDYQNHYTWGHYYKYFVIDEE